MSIAILRGDARALPLPDESVDLIVTSPPYYKLRDYRDSGGSLDGQIGAERTPREYVDSLLECTAEWARVLKPSGSIFVNIGDKYAGSGGDGNRGLLTPKFKGNTVAVPPNGGKRWGAPPKTLLALPWRYAIGCADQLGLILRRDIIWRKLNHLPESVTDRCATSHEYLFHLVRQPRYYSAAAEIREPHAEVSIRRAMPHRAPPGRRDAEIYAGSSGQTLDLAQANHPLGKMPGSVWDIASQPLVVPAELDLDHFAAFPFELPRRCILGWSPSGICGDCGEGRYPVVSKPGLLGGDNNPDSRNGSRKRSTMDGGSREWALRASKPDRITGHACACTPFTDHGPSDRQSSRRDRAPEATRPHGDYARKQAGEYERVGPWREYHLDGWASPPTRPALVIDPFGGTGTTALMADVLGRDAITFDRSADYCRLARWRTTDPGERARAMQVPKPPVIPDGQDALFDLEAM